MCGRFANQQESTGAWDEYFETPYPNTDTFSKSVSIGYNIAPTQTIPIVTNDGWLAARWGIVAPWANEISTKFATFNARMETLAEKVTFRGAWKKGQRCIIPAIGYYEWKKEGEEKQPYFIRPEKDAPMFLAGLYEPQRSSIPPSCTIITTSACDALAHLHPRMPIVLDRDGITPWLKDASQQAASHKFIHFQVSRVVNNVRNQGSALIQSNN